MNTANRRPLKILLMVLGHIEPGELLRDAAYRDIWRRTGRRVRRLYGYRPARP